MTMLKKSLVLVCFFTQVFSSFASQEECQEKNLDDTSLHAFYAFRTLVDLEQDHACTLCMLGEKHTHGIAFTPQTHSETLERLHKIPTKLFCKAFEELQEATQKGTFAREIRPYNDIRTNPLYCDAEVSGFSPLATTYASLLVFLEGCNLCESAEDLYEGFYNPYGWRVTYLKAAVDPQETGSVLADLSLINPDKLRALFIEAYTWDGVFFASPIIRKDLACLEDDLSKGIFLLLIQLPARLSHHLFLDVIDPKTQTIDQEKLRLANLQGLERTQQTLRRLRMD